MEERVYIFPEDIKALVAKAPEPKSVTMKLFNKEGAEENEGEENSKADDTQGKPA